MENLLPRRGALGLELTKNFAFGIVIEDGKVEKKYSLMLVKMIMTMVCKNRVQAFSKNDFFCHLSDGNVQKVAMGSCVSSISTSIAQMASHSCYKNIYHSFSRNLHGAKLFATFLADKWFQPLWGNGKTTQCFLNQKQNNKKDTSLSQGKRKNTRKNIRLIPRQVMIQPRRKPPFFISASWHVVSAVAAFPHHICIFFQLPEFSPHTAWKKPCEDVVFAGKKRLHAVLPFWCGAQGAVNMRCAPIFPELHINLGFFSLGLNLYLPSFHWNCFAAFEWCWLDAWVQNVPGQTQYFFSSKTWILNRWYCRYGTCWNTSLLTREKTGFKFAHNIFKQGKFLAGPALGKLSRLSWLFASCLGITLMSFLVVSPPAMENSYVFLGGLDSCLENSDVFPGSFVPCFWCLSYWFSLLPWIIVSAFQKFLRPGAFASCPALAQIWFFSRRFFF